jgi:NhaA family Na+:H+ antiporter
VTRRRYVVLGHLSTGERRFLTDVLRKETVGGALLLAAAIAALILANTPGHEIYERLREFEVGPDVLHLRLSLETWAADGLLAIFFFVAGLELKRELVLGSLSRPADAALPIAAAVAGMAVPAMVYLAVTRFEPATLDGWAVPTATDIAFALAVLAVIGSRLPSGLRAFLLTLAVVDDVLAIVIIAAFYTAELNLLSLLGAIAIFAFYVLLQRKRVTSPLIYVPLALIAWGLVHESGVHATVAGVAFGLLTRCRHDKGEERSPAERLEHRLNPLSAGVAVPAFAFFAAGVPVGGEALRGLLSEPAALGVALGLFVGKAVGVFLGAFLTSKFTNAHLSDELSWWDVLGLAVVSGVGFTVALLIGELAFAADPERLELVKAAVLVGSLTSALTATVILRARQNVYVRMAAEDSANDSSDVPEVDVTSERAD